MSNLSKAAKLLIKDMSNCPMLNGDEDIIATVESGEYKNKQKLVMKVAERVFSAISSCTALPPKSIVKHLFYWLDKQKFCLSKLVDCAEETLKNTSWNLQYIVARNPRSISKEQLQSLEMALDLSQSLCKSLAKTNLSILIGEMYIAQNTLHDAQAAYVLAHPVPAPKPGLFIRFWNWFCDLISSKVEHTQNKPSKPIANNPLIITSSVAKILASEIGERMIPQPIPVLASQNSYAAMQPTPPPESFAEMKI